MADDPTAGARAGTRRSSPAELDAALAVAERASRRAGAIQLERYERFERVQHKSSRDVVTEVDHLCEEVILEEIRRAFPGDAILAEESGSHEGTGAGEASGRVWLVDPLDGTVNYANGLPFFCASVAMAVGGVVQAGVVFDPVHDELFSAIRGRGARLDGRAVRNPDKERLIDYVVSLGLKTREISVQEPTLRRTTRASRHLGSSALGLAYVACGRFDAFTQVTGMSNWDIAAAGLIAEEGGALVTTLAGEPWFDLSRPSASVGLLAAPPRHHAELLALLR